LWILSVKASKQRKRYENPHNERRDSFEAIADIERCQFIEKQAKVLTEDLNMAEQAVVSTILGGYDDVEAGLIIAASVVADTFNYGVNELCSEMSSVGYTASTIASVVSDVFEASPQEVASGLLSAGFTVEHAFESAFGEGAGAVSKEFGLIGNTITSGIDESVGVMQSFFVGDVGGVAQDLGNDFKDAGDTIADGAKHLGNDIADGANNFFHHLF
jgi:hypothetical protein